jgi:DME family drug/metabolite transporter
MSKLLFKQDACAAKSKKLYHYLFLVFASICWGITGVVSKFAFQKKIDPQEVAFYRCLIAGFLFLFQSLIDKSFFHMVRTISKKDGLSIFCFSLFGVAGISYFYMNAVLGIGAGVAAVFLYTAPIWVFLFSLLFWKEKSSFFKIFALAISFLGVVLLSFPFKSNFSFLNLSIKYLLFALLSGFSFSLFYIFGKIYFVKFKAQAFYAISFLLASLFLLPLVKFHSINVEVLFVFLSNGVFSTWLGYYLYSKGLEKINATQASVITTLEPVIAVVLGVFFWNELLSFINIVGAFLVIFGAMLVTFMDFNKKVVEQSQQQTHHPL